MIGLLLAQAVAAAYPAEGAISYPPAFFAAQRPANAFEMLARVPGFILDYGNGARGFEGSAGNVLIDGRRPTSKTDSLRGFLERTPAARVARIDVIRGGAPGVDMQGKAVLANVVLKAEPAIQGQIEAEGFDTGDGRQVGAVKVEASGGETVAWEVSGLAGRGFSGLLGQGVGQSGTSDGPGPRSRIDTEDDGTLRQATGAVRAPVFGGTLRLNAYAYNDRIKFEEDDVDLTSGAASAYDERTADRNRELGANFARPLSPRTQLELVGLWQAGGVGISGVSTAPDGRQDFDLDRSTREAIGRAVLKQTWTVNLSSEVGAEIADNRLKTTSGFQVDGVAVPLPAANVQVRERRVEAFAKASWRPGPAWNVDGQLRYETATLRADGDVRLAKTLQYLKPRVLITWSPGKATQLRIRGEREVDQLDFDAFVAQGSLNSATGVTAGNPDLEPERAWVAEAAFEQRFWDRGALVLTTTHSEVQGVVDRGPVFTLAGVFDRPENIGDGTRDSVKLELTAPLDRLGLPRVLLKGFVVRRWSEVDDPTTRQPRRISGQRPVEWELKLSQDLPAQNLTWGAELFGGYQRTLYRFNARDTYKLDPFLMTYVEWRPRSDVQVRLEWQNITRRGYQQSTTTYTGLRDPDGVGPATLSDRNFHFGRIVYARVRKTFGG